MALLQENKRTDSIRVRLSPEMMDRFEQLAKGYGMPPATLGAFAVARFVQQEENNAKLNRMAVLDATRNSSDKLDQVFSEDSMEKILGPMFKAMIEQMSPDVVKSLEQKNPPLDGEATNVGA